METLGTLKIYIHLRTAHPVRGVIEGRKMILSVWGLSKEESKSKLREFISLNKGLNFCNASWQPNEEPVEP